MEVELNIYCELMFVETFQQSRYSAHGILLLALENGKMELFKGI